MFRASQRRNKLALRSQELAIQHRRTRATADGIVREHDELPVQQRAGAQAAHGSGHAIAPHAVQPRLRAVFAGAELYRLQGRGRQRIPSQRRELIPGGENFLSCCPRRQLDADALRVAVFHCHAIAVRTYPGIQSFHPGAIELAQQFERLGFELLFFAADVRNYIAQDVQRRNAWITGAADRLHGADKYALQAKALRQWFERQHQPDGAAVGVGHDVAAGLLAPVLRLEQAQVGCVDLGNHQWNIRLHAKCAGIGDYGATRSGKLRLQFARNVGVEGGEDHARRALRSRGGDHHRGDTAGEWGIQLPAHGLAVAFAAGLVTGGQPRDFKPRVPLEQLDEALTDDSRSAKNAYLVSCLHGRIVVKRFLLILDHSAGGGLARITAVNACCCSQRSQDGAGKGFGATVSAHIAGKCLLLDVDLLQRQLHPVGSVVLAHVAQHQDG